MVLELGGFIEPVNEPGPQTLVNNQYSRKAAKQIETNDVILFDLRPHKVLDVLYTEVPSPIVTITAHDAWRNATVQLKILEPNKSMDLVRTKVWEYLVREVDSTISGTKSDDTEVSFKIPGDQVDDTLGPFFRLVEESGASIILKVFEAMGRYQVIGCSVGYW